MATEREQCVDELLVRTNEIDDLSKRLEVSVTDELIGESRESLTKTRAYIDNNRAIIPSYTLKKISESLNRLEKQINNSSRSKLKFKFKAKSTDSTSSSLGANSFCPKTNDCGAIKAHPGIVQPNFFGFQDRNNEHLTLTGAEVESKDISLVGLSNCTVSIVGLANTVYIRNLTNTSVIIVLACRAITVKNCSKCILKLICQQLRIDSTIDCSFSIFTSARSMLESSKDLKFEELKLGDLNEKISSKQLCDLMDRANFNGERNNWRCIDDFDWLSEEVPSKNYKLMPGSSE